MQFLLPTVVLLALASGVAAQCTGNDHPNCLGWKNNGYCTNTAQSMDTRKKYCGVLCESWVASKNFCARTDYSNSIKLLYCCKTCRPIIFPTATAATDGNANCAKWAKNTTQAFCASKTITMDQKTRFCAKTCEFEIKPTADCALYTVTGTELARGTPSNKTATPGTAVPSGVKTGTTLSRVFAKTGCSVKLFAVAQPTDTATGEAQKFEGKANDNFFEVTPTNNGALSYTCTCA